MLGLISANRSWSRRLLFPWRLGNPAFWWVIWGALGFLAAVLYIPSLSKLFRFTVLHPDDLAVCFTAGAITFFLVEIIKRWGRKHREPR
jgi:Ca2+-transporting ATPase